MKIVAIALALVLASDYQVVSGTVLSGGALDYRLSYDAEMTSFHFTTSVVYHMEPDLYVKDNVLYADGSALRTTNGRDTETATTVTVAGSSTQGLVIGVGTLARFRFMTGFRQISPTKVVVVDRANHCLRIIDRLTLETPRYAGTCGSNGSTDGTDQAKFKEPWGIISDMKSPGMLLVNDIDNHAIRHVNTALPAGDGPRSVSTFYDSNGFLHGHRHLTQDPVTGDLFTAAVARVYRLTYYTKVLSDLAGSFFNHGFSDGPFSSTKFDNARGIIAIEGGAKLLVTDSQNDRVRVLDMITNITTSLCTGTRAHTDGDLTTCQLNYPNSLMATRDALFIGEVYRIRKVQVRQGRCPRYNPAFYNYDSGLDCQHDADCVRGKKCCTVRTYPKQCLPVTWP